VAPAQGSEQNKDLKALSGGERSFSTVCFILSLWNAMESPFRFLDEFDVFMVMTNFYRCVWCLYGNDVVCTGVCVCHVVFTGVVCRGESCGLCWCMVLCTVVCVGVWWWGKGFIMVSWCFMWLVLLCVMCEVLLYWCCMCCDVIHGLLVYGDVQSALYWCMVECKVLCTGVWWIVKWFVLVSGGV
jgi:hypothetical protein